jgi:hypothetical protein
VASLCCPWYIDKGEVGSEADSIVFDDLFDGFAAFLKLSKDLIKEKNGWGLVAASTFLYGLPYFSLTGPKSEALEPDDPLDGFWAHRIQLDLHPVSQAPKNEVWLARVQSAVGDNIESGLRGLLQMELSPSEKHRFRNAEMQQTLVAQEAGWLFSVDQHDVTDGRYLRATLVDDGGNKLCAAGAKLRKAELNWNSDLAAYVLSSEYDGKHPVAIIKGISKKTAKLVASHFECKEVGNGERTFHDIDNQRYLRQLMQRMQPGGAAYE